MPRNLTNEEFIKKATKIHGNKYNYDKTLYKNMKDKIIILCPFHGEFSQQPDSHLKGSGCKNCNNKNGIQKKMTTKTFIEISGKIWKDKIDYSKTKFNGTKQKATFICTKHREEFTQICYDHKKGNIGCDQCKKEKSREIIEKRGEHYVYIEFPEIYAEIDEKRFKEKYKDKKMTDLTIGSHINIWWKCKNNPKHTWHCELKSRIPTETQIKGTGCRECAKNSCGRDNNLLVKRPELTKEWDFNLNKISPEKYAEYSHEEVYWICPLRGCHYRMKISERTSQGSSCGQCNGNEFAVWKSLANNFPEILKEWDYEMNTTIEPTKISYGSSEEVYWKCKMGHKWKVSINSRTSLRTGCPDCNDTRKYSKKAIEWLNYMSEVFNITIQHAENGGEYVIENIKSKRWKADGYCEERLWIFEFLGDNWHSNPEIFIGKENEINVLTKKTHKETYEQTMKRLDIISNSGYIVIYIWESEWEKIKNKI